MKNDIRIIKNEINDITNEKKQREKERQEAKKLKEFKQLCSDLIYTTIYNSVEHGTYIKNIYKQRKTIINTILQDIKCRYIEIEDMSTFEDKKKKVRLYNYPDYEIIRTLTDIFNKEYAKIERELKKAETILLEELKGELKSVFNEVIDGRPQGLSINALIQAMELKESKNAKIKNIAETEQEAQILNTIYYKTLAEVKKEYKGEDILTSQKQEKLALPWRLIGYKKALETIWKL